MSKNNKSIEQQKENDDSINAEITWEEVYEKIPKLIDLINHIVTDKYESFDDKISLEKYLDEHPSEIIEEEPYIMEENDFDKVDFYKYILKCALYYLKEEKEISI